jgi:hypothetical protein
VKTVLVVGAGGSLANALYFRGQRMRDTLPPLDTTFFEVVQARKIALSAALRTYLRSVLGVDATTTALADRRMEQVFADVFYDFNERTVGVALDAYIDLVDLYLRVLRETTNWLCADGRRGGPVGTLLAAGAAVSDDVSIITFNHDLVIENEIHRRARLRPRWCLDRGYGSLSSELNVLVPADRSPTFHVHADGQCDHARAIRVLKLHGSLNWCVRINSARPTANLLSGAAQRDLQLVNRRQLPVGREVYTRRSRGRGRTQWRLWPVVVPPVYAKQALRGAIQSVWTDARSAVEDADRLVIFGYSLPGIDIEAEKLFERAVARNPRLRWIDVVNPDPASAARWAHVGGRKALRWFPSVDEFVAQRGFD